MTWSVVRFFSGIFPGMIAKSFYPQFSKTPMGRLEGEDVHALISSMKHYNSGQGFLNDIDQRIDDSILTKIKCPTLIIHSRNDSSASFEHALRAKKMIRDSKLVGLNNKWGHLFWIGSDSKAAIDETLNFIDK